MAPKQPKKTRSLQAALEEILTAIINEWYERVSGYYVTQENRRGKQNVELKRFHDPDKGHRIKFNKDNLDFTYGLRSSWQGDDFAIEISVNNKVENFDYDNFRRQLFSHYQKAGKRKVVRPERLKNALYNEVLQLESEISDAFTVERRSSKADIMRLTFQIPNLFLDDLASDPDAAKQLIESYCVSPFRSIYAKVYRRDNTR